MALQEFYTELRGAFRTLGAARRWLHEARLHAFGDRTPLERLLEWKLERVTGLFWDMNSGMMT